LSKLVVLQAGYLVLALGVIRPHVQNGVAGEFVFGGDHVVVVWDFEGLLVVHEFDLLLLVQFVVVLAVGLEVAAFVHITQVVFKIIVHFCEEWVVSDGELC